MRKQSFKSYLTWYLRDLTGEKTLSIHALAKESERNRRLVGPLLLYCALIGRQERLNHYTQNRYREVLLRLNETNFRDDEFAAFDFAKVWESYQKKQRRVEYDNEIKQQARDFLLSLLREKGITQYRLCVDLGLNYGNVHDYLSRGNCNKVSLRVVHSMADYLRAKA